MVSPIQKIAWLLLVPYFLCGIVLCVLVWNRKYCDSLYYYYPAGDDEGSNTTSKSTGGGNSTAAFARVQMFWNFELRSRSNRFCAAGYHGILSVLGTLLVGFTIIIFRLLIHTRTKKVMYYHLLLHSLTLMLFICGLWCIFSHEYSIIYDGLNFHRVTSWILLLVVALQYASGALFYFYRYPNIRSWNVFSPLHAGLGIWIFLCCVACCISGRNQAELDYTGNNRELFLAFTYVCFSCILIVILSPFFEWKEVFSTAEIRRIWCRTTIRSKRCVITPRLTSTRSNTATTSKRSRPKATSGVNINAKNKSTSTGTKYSRGANVRLTRNRKKLATGSIKSISKTIQGSRTMITLKKNNESHCSRGSTEHDKVCPLSAYETDT